MFRSRSDLLLIKALHRLYGASLSLFVFNRNIPFDDHEFLNELTVVSKPEIPEKGYMVFCHGFCDPFLRFYLKKNKLAQVPYFYDHVLWDAEKFLTADLNLVISQLSIDSAYKNLRLRYGEAIASLCASKMRVVGRLLFDNLSPDSDHQFDEPKSLLVIGRSCLDYYSRSLLGKDVISACVGSVRTELGVSSLARALLNRRALRLAECVKGAAEDLGLRLIFKSRPKDRRYLVEQFDRVGALVVEGSSDPLKNHQVTRQYMQNSSFGISINSFSVMEFVGSGIPVSAVIMAKLSSEVYGADQSQAYQSIRSSVIGSMYNWPGASRVYYAEKVEGLIAPPSIDRASQHEYVSRYFPKFSAKELLCVE